MADEVLQALERYARPNDVAEVGKFFKSYDGGYSQHDQFLAIKVPCIREVSKKYANLSLQDIEAVLESPLHEMRLLAAIIMANQAKSRRSSEAHKTALFDLYIRRTDRINNWDIVDTSCRDVAGEYILEHPQKTDILRKLALSQDIWERRIAMVSTWAMIRKNQLDLPYEIAETLLRDNHDLIHKAVGWMLRTAGDKDQDRLREFIITHITHIPRTALRYAIEHFDSEERKYFLTLR
ncbi:MAG TPA: DNA alkylation repair protein [Candidatus Saccharimonadales bacterium]|nr:DNA alkylation repair protein [Candidatus Saccharimonadales bacterium]